MHPLRQYKSASIYSLTLLAGAVAAFVLLLALANGPSWIYVWQISGFGLSYKIEFILDSAYNAIRFGGHILPMSWIVLSAISGYMLAEYIHVGRLRRPGAYNHYSWLAPLLVALGLFLTGFSASSIFASTNRLLFTASSESVRAALVALLGVTQGILAAIYTYRWSRHIRKKHTTPER